MTAISAELDGNRGVHSARREIPQAETALHHAFRKYGESRDLRELGQAIRLARRSGVEEVTISNLINSYGLRFRLH